MQNRETIRCASCLENIPITQARTYINKGKFFCTKCKSLECGSCAKKVKNNIHCSLCMNFYHVKCAQLRIKDFQILKKKDLNWTCFECHKELFPFTNLNDKEFNEVLLEDYPVSIQPLKKSKCGSCSKRVRKNNRGVYCFCYSCNYFFHKKCAKLNNSDLTQIKTWECTKCSIGTLPFSRISDNDLSVALHGFDEASSEFLKNVPSFSIQSLLDQLPGQHFNTDDFLSDSIDSKYYTPTQFVSAKFPHKIFSMIHLNIASLSAHIDELRSLLIILGHPFDVICLTETRIHDENPINNFQIDGYDFLHTPTSTKCGGAGMYIRSGYDPIKVHFQHPIRILQSQFL